LELVVFFVIFLLIPLLDDFSIVSDARSSKWALTMKKLIIEGTDGAVGGEDEVADVPVLKFTPTSTIIAGTLQQSRKNLIHKH